jgi:hypothetical protein
MGSEAFTGVFHIGKATTISHSFITGNACDYFVAGSARTMTFRDCYFDSFTFPVGNEAQIATAECQTTNSGVAIPTCAIFAEVRALACNRIVNGETDSARSVISQKYADCSVTGDGGWIYFSIGTVSITYCSFTSCKATSNGGAIYLSGSGILHRIARSVFLSCSASTGAGIYFTGTAITVISCVFAHGKSTGTEASVMYNNGALTFAESIAIFSTGGHNTFQIANTGNPILTASNTTNNDAMQSGQSLHFWPDLHFSACRAVLLGRQDLKSL